MLADTMAENPTSSKFLHFSQMLSLQNSSKLANFRTSSKIIAILEVYPSSSLDLIYS